MTAALGLVSDLGTIATPVCLVSPAKPSSNPAGHEFRKQSRLGGPHCRPRAAGSSGHGPRAAIAARPDSTRQLLPDCRPRCHRISHRLRNRPRLVCRRNRVGRNRGSSRTSAAAGPIPASLMMPSLPALPTKHWTAPISTAIRVSSPPVLLSRDGWWMLKWASCCRMCDQRCTTR